MPTRLAREAQRRALRAFQQARSALGVARVLVRLVFGEVVGIERPTNAIFNETVAKHCAAVIQHDGIALALGGPQHPANHLAKKPILRVGRARMQHPTSGISQPSVKTMQLVTTSISPDASRASDASRSGFGVVPSMCSQRTPDFTNSSRMWMLCWTLTANATVRRRSTKLVPVANDVADQLGAIHPVGELVLDVVAEPGMHAFQVGLDRRIDPRRHQPTALDQVGHLRAFDDGFKDAAEPATIAPARRGGEPQHDGIGIGRDDFAVGAGRAMVSLVDHQQVGGREVTGLRTLGSACLARTHSVCTDAT